MDGLISPFTSNGTLIRKMGNNKKYYYYNL